MTANSKPPTANLNDGPSRVLRYDGSGWAGVPARPYKTVPGDFAGVARYILADPEAAAFQVRYFEVEPGGHSSHERHEHVHVVVCLRGRGKVRLPGREEAIGFGDVVYVAPGDAHQFSTVGDEPFGFLCIVDRERDRPVPMGG